jgi:hypothetical protein
MQHGSAAVLFTLSLAAARDTRRAGAELDDSRALSLSALDLSETTIHREFRASNVGGV